MFPLKSWSVLRRQLRYDGRNWRSSWRIVRVRRWRFGTSNKSIHQVGDKKKIILTPKIPSLQCLRRKTYGHLWDCWSQGKKAYSALKEKHCTWGETKGKRSPLCCTPGWINFQSLFRSLKAITIKQNLKVKAHHSHKSKSGSAPDVVAINS